MIHGTLASTRLDFDLYLCDGIRGFPDAVRAGVCLGERVDFLAGSVEKGGSSIEA
jgi:hypothetical protein